MESSLICICLHVFCLYHSWGTEESLLDEKNSDILIGMIVAEEFVVDQ